jgi:hypothetical protein
VRREGLDLGEWLVTVAQTYERLLDDAGVAPPQWQTFRPGSWDSGSSPSDLEQYIDALVSNRMTFTSGAASGIFGTPSERIGANYGDNVFRLSKGPIEVAPCVFLDCGAPLGSRSWAGAARRMLGQAGAFAREEGGALVTVLHLDHLFHVRERGVYRYFVVDDEAVVEARVDRFFRYLAACRRLMGVEPITFEELPETFAR